MKNLKMKVTITGIISVPPDAYPEELKVKTSADAAKAELKQLKENEVSAMSLLECCQTRSIKANIEPMD